MPLIAAAPRMTSSTTPTRATITPPMTIGLRGWYLISLTCASNAMKQPSYLILNLRIAGVASGPARPTARTSKV